MMPGFAIYVCPECGDERLVKAALDPTWRPRCDRFRDSLRKPLLPARCPGYAEPRKEAA